MLQQNHMDRLTLSFVKGGLGAVEWLSTEYGELRFFSIFSVFVIPESGKQFDMIVFTSIYT